MEKEMTTSNNYFTELLAVDVTEHLDRKGHFSYLSWPYAVLQLRTFDEKATWEIKRFDGLPYQRTEFGTFVEVAVTVKGVCLSQIHPVLDSRNQPIKTPSAFEINTSIQRCLVKAIALHGLGLNVYAGEDLVNIDGRESVISNHVNTLREPFKAALTKIKATSSPELLTANQLRYIKKLIIETGTDEEQLLSYLDVY